MSAKRSLLLLACVALAALLPAHVRLLNPSNGSALYWSNPDSISIVIQSTGSDDITDGSHVTAIRNAIASWNAVSGTAARLVENTNPAQQARTDWQSDSLHTVIFDEDDYSGYFPNGSGIVAITPTWFSGGGSISDSDVLFNGRAFHFTTSAVVGRYDVQDVATHELGHLLGLDHSPWAGATMYPYVDPTILLHRSLSQDEIHGMRDMYPSGSRASIHGTLRHSNTRPVRCAQVVAVDSSGRPHAGAVSSSGGVWRIRGLDPDTYTLYAMPIDSPVTARNFGGGQTVQIDFRMTPLGTAQVSGAEDFDAGSATVLAESMLEFGRVLDDFPRRVVRGVVNNVTLHGSGLVAGSTLVCSDPNVLVSVVTWADTRVQFTADVPIDAPIGQLDLTVTNPAGESRTLVAGLEITPPNPAVASVDPAQGTDGGGTLVTLHGSNFRTGQEVVLGGTIYVDGAAGGCEVLDASTIRLTTAATAPGTFDVVVIDPTGVEGRLVAGFVFAHIPEIQSTFPAGGYAGGGTEVVLRGQNFEDGAVVRIDGVPQTQVVRTDANELVVTTGAGVPGGPYLLEVENPGGAIATSAFSYSADPDPLLVLVDPPAGPQAGGNTLTLHGSNLGAATAVVFGADAQSGAGGTPAASFDALDADTLEVVAPAHGLGTLSLLVRNDATGQAVLLPAAYTFQSAGGGAGGGGGGCYVEPYVPTAGPRELLAGAWWLVALFLALHWRAWLRRTSSPSTSR